MSWATALGSRALLLALALLTTSPALAGDVSVKLDAGSGFSVKDNTGTIERLRVDEATGNVAQRRALRAHDGSDNTFVGKGAGNPATTGAGSNSASGTDALRDNTTGFSNSAFGYTRSATTVWHLNSAVGAPPFAPTPWALATPPSGMPLSAPTPQDPATPPSVLSP